MASQVPSQAFALAGLAGSNSWGAGFLHTALQQQYRDRIRPKLISCTSGQLYWAYVYLRLRDGGTIHGIPNIRDLLQQQIEETQSYHLSAAVPFIGGTEFQDFDYLELCCRGIPHKFHVPWMENLVDGLRNVLFAVPEAIADAQKSRQIFLLKEMMRVWPANFLKPDFAAEMYEDIATTVARSDVGFCFNSYDPQTGTECVHVNRAAQDIFQESGKKLTIYRNRTVAVDFNVDTQQTRENAVTAVRNALWLIFFGPPNDKRPIDAAYYRHVMLRELVPAEAIFVVRPINYHWHGLLPNRFLDMLDFLTQAFFNGVYAGEREQIVTMNALRERYPALKEAYHPIELWEIEPDLAESELVQGFFDYVFEEMALFDAACTLTRDRFDQFLSGKMPPGSAESACCAGEGWRRI